MRVMLSTFFVCLFFAFGFSQHASNLQSTESHLEIPCYDHTAAIVKHQAYSLEYNEQHEQASWVAYQLTSAETNNTFKRSNKFVEDPMVKTGSAKDADYAGSGYDRGHLAPAADMGWSQQTMEESFYFSNMSPQVPAFNRGIWKSLEELVRFWAQSYDSIYIVTGPVLSEGLSTIGSNHVSVPHYYYKVILDYHQGKGKAIGFLLPNAGSDLELEHFAVSVDSVEHFTGINFYCGLPDSTENRLEKSYRIQDWLWKAEKKHVSNNVVPVYPGADHTTPKSSAIEQTHQCTGITKKGTRCKNKVKTEGGKCHIHDGID